MIVVKIQGGLGNQLYQWVFYKTLKEIYNIESYIDISQYTNNNTREFSLNKFPYLDYNIFEKNNKNIPIKYIYDNFEYKPIIYTQNCINYFDGYWQNIQYLNKLNNKIKEFLKPSDNFNFSCIEKDSVSMHIRRTDYLNLQDYHPILPISYYEKAINSIKKFNKIYIFSDDIKWCKNNINFKNCIFVENTVNVESMWLMSKCKYNIIANSTFSWWGAWLNSNKNKIIFAPSKWFGPKYNSKYINFNNIPNSWNIINID